MVNNTSGILTHTKHDAVNVMVTLGSNGIYGEVIGTLPSKHDIDILITKPKDNPELRAKIISILKPKNWKGTDWNGMFLYETQWGNVDIFFEKPPRSPIPC